MKTVSPLNGELPVLLEAMAMGDIHPAPTMSTTIYVLFRILCILTSSGITSFAKNNRLDGEVKDADGNPRIFFKQLTF